MKRGREIIGWILAIILALAAGMWAGPFIIPRSMHVSSTDFLDVNIYPRNIKLYVGETQLFQAVLYNGTSPYSYQWYSNDTFIGSEATVEFGFVEPCNYIILSVTDSVGSVGTDSVLVYDPTEVLAVSKIVSAMLGGGK